MGITYWNKIIDLDFFNNNGTLVGSIKCPLKGRKPNITLTGAFYNYDTANNFSVTVKNFYFDALIGTFSRVVVHAGYEGCKHLALDGHLVSVHQQSPGPESTTVLQFRSGSGVLWLTSWIDINLDKGYTLPTVLNRISKQLKFKAPIISEQAIQLTSNTAFQFQGLCKDAINHLEASFENLYITNQGDTLIARLKDDKSSTRLVFDIPYLKAPPNITSGAENTFSGATITALWNPLLKPGDWVTFNALYYTTTLELLNFRSEKARMEIESIQFHFGTVTSENEMTIMGHVI